VTPCPMLSPGEARQVYDQIGVLQDSQAFYEGPAFDALSRYGRFENARTVVEVGCGTGYFADRLLRDHLPTDSQYVGVDVSATMVNRARERLSAYRKRVRIQCTDGSFSFDIADHSQDRVVATYLLDLLRADDRRAVLREARRLLRPSGRLCLAGLTWGTTVPTRVVSTVWNLVHAVRPRWVGGCRPMHVQKHLCSDRWRTLHHDVVRAWGIPSEIVIATPA